MTRTMFVPLGLLLAMPVQAEEIDQTKDVDETGKIEIFNMAGDLEVIGWDRSEVRVSGTLGDDVEDFIFETSGKHTTIKVKVPDRVRGHKDVSSDLRIQVPKACAIDANGVSTDISIEDVEGELDLQSVSGDIELDVFAADVDVETVSGDVDASGNNSEGEARLETVSGDVMADGLSGELRAGAVSGDVDVSDGDFSRAKIETVNGDVTYAAVLRDSARLDVETVNGTVDINFIGDVNASFDIETFNGRIRNCFGPDAKRTSKYAPGWELSFKEGNGSARVDISTLNGGLKLCKE